MIAHGRVLGGVRVELGGVLFRLQLFQRPAQPLLELAVDERDAPFGIVEDEHHGAVVEDLLEDFFLQPQGLLVPLVLPDRAHELRRAGSDPALELVVGGRQPRAGPVEISDEGGVREAQVHGVDESPSSGEGDSETSPRRRGRPSRPARRALGRPRGAVAP